MDIENVLVNFDRNRYMSLGDYSVQKRNGDLYFNEVVTKNGERETINIAIYHSRTRYIIWIFGKFNNVQQYNELEVYNKFRDMFKFPNEDFYVDSMIKSSTLVPYKKYAIVSGVDYSFKKCKVLLNGKERFVYHKECTKDYNYYDKCVCIPLEDMTKILSNRYSRFENEIVCIEYFDDENDFSRNLMIAVINELRERSTRVILYTKYNLKFELRETVYAINRNQLDNISAEDFYTRKHEIISVEGFITEYFKEKLKVISRVKSAAAI